MPTEPLTHKLSVSAIAAGTVIDHITAGQALRILSLLKLDRQKRRVTLGLNLPSQKLGLKDLIKVEDRYIDAGEANQIALFAPEATLSIIQNYQLVKKFSVQMPSYIARFLACPNATCITHVEKIESGFNISIQEKRVHLVCKYCTQGFYHDAH